MYNFLADILPFDPDRNRRVVEDVPKIVTDSLDTIQNTVQEVTDGVSSGGGHSLFYIIGGIVAALVGLGFLIFMVRNYLKSGQVKESLG